MGLSSLFYIPIAIDMSPNRKREACSGLPLCGNIDSVSPILAKVGGLQSQGAKGEAVVNLLRTLGNAESEVLRLSRRVNNTALNRLPSFEFPLGWKSKMRIFQ
jgi:hypothetical protein